jgi:signal transduction histidine kinase
MTSSWVATMKLRTILLLAFLTAGLAITGLSFLEGYRLEMIMAMLAVLLLMAGMALYISQLIAIPLARLAHNADEIAAGRFTQPFVAPAIDDIARLSASLTHMTTSLVREIEHRRLAEDHLQRSREQLHNLSIHLQTVREEECIRIARDIHDDLGQCLTTLKLNLALLADDAPASTSWLPERIGEMTEMVDKTIRSVHRIIAELRPRILDDLGLTAAIEWLVSDFQKRAGIPVELSVYPPEIILDRERSTAVFRIVQEALLNVTRHAKATGVRVDLTDIDGKLELRISDNGRGITPGEIEDSRSFGLMGIRERARGLRGSAMISGQPNEGTTVAVSFSTTDEEHEQQPQQPEMRDSLREALR